MKIIAALFVGLFLLAAAPGEARGQKRKITVIVVRHAEKDTTDQGSDPNLSAEGRQRAARLAKLIRKYKPKRIYSTNYKRTLQTVAPLAEKRAVEVQIYEPLKQTELVAQLKSFRKGRRIVVVGHGNTVPAFLNLLVGENKYKNLAENEYNKIWIIRLKKGKIRIQLIEY